MPTTVTDVCLSMFVAHIFSACTREGMLEHWCVAGHGKKMSLRGSEASEDGAIDKYWSSRVRPGFWRLTLSLAVVTVGSLGGSEMWLEAGHDLE